MSRERSDHNTSPHSILSHFASLFTLSNAHAKETAASHAKAASISHTNTKSSQDVGHMQLDKYTTNYSILFPTTPQEVRVAVDKIKCGTIMMMLYSNGCGHCHHTMEDLQNLFADAKMADDVSSVTWMLLCDDYPGMLQAMQAYVPEKRITGYPTMWILYKSPNTIMFKGTVVRGSAKNMYDSIVPHTGYLCTLPARTKQQYNTVLTKGENEENIENAKKSPIETLRDEPRVKWITQVPPPFESKRDDRDEDHHNDRYIVLYVYLTACHTCHKVAKVLKQRLQQTPVESFVVEYRDAISTDSSRIFERAAVMDQCEWWMMDGEQDSATTWLQHEQCSDDGYPMLILYTRSGKKIGEIEVSLDSDKWAAQVERMCTPLAYEDQVWTK